MKDLTNRMVVGLFVILLVLGMFAAGKYVGWGFIETKQQNKITVVGEAKDQLQSQVANISAGVNVTKESKDEAVKEVNEAMDKLNKSVKAEGILAADIKTTGSSIYQQTESYWDNGVQKQRPSGWSVSNNIDITVRDINKVSTLMGVLSSSGATNVNGPYYSIDKQGNEMDEALRKEAFDDAVRKAGQMAKLAGRSLGKVVSMQEYTGGGISPLERTSGLGGGGGGSYEPGSATVGRSVMVEFELK